MTAASTFWDTEVFCFLKYTQRTGQLSLRGEQSNLETVCTFVVYLKQKTDKNIILIELRY